MTPVIAVRAVEVLAAGGVVVSSLEVLARPAWLADSSWNSWTVHRLARPVTAGRAFGGAVTLVAGWPRVLALVAVTAAAGVGLLYPTSGALRAVLLTIVVFGVAVRMLRAPYGGEGSDQVLLVVFAALALGAWRPSDAVATAVLWFVAGQACLAYFTSGASKLFAPAWQSGDALLGVAGTAAWGNPVVADWLQARPVTTRWASRAVAAAEACFPLVLLAPDPVVPWLLVAGGAFHLLVAVAMGLNCFVWAFVATYPAILYVAWSI